MNRNLPVSIIIKIPKLTQMYSVLCDQNWKANENEIIRFSFQKLLLTEQFFFYYPVYLESVKKRPLN